MLKPLPIRKIDAALAKWGTPWTHADVDWIDVDPTETYIELRTGDYLTTESNPEATKQLYGGNLDDVARIEVFNRGYAVHLKTDVFDGKTMVCEVRVGGLC